MRLPEITAVFDPNSRILTLSRPDDVPERILEICKAELEYFINVPATKVTLALIDDEIIRCLSTLVEIGDARYDSFNKEWVMYD